MKATIKGTVLEKYTRDVTTPSGAKEKKYYLRLYQKGVRVNTDVNVSYETFNLVDEGELVDLPDITISTFRDNLYARE